VMRVALCHCSFGSKLLHTTVEEALCINLKKELGCL